MAQHGGEGEKAHQRHHGADDAGRGGEQRAGDERCDGERTGQPARGELDRAEQPVEDVGALDDVAHEDEERHGDQDVVGHHRPGALHEQRHHLFHVAVEGEEGEAHAHRHQREGDREAEHDEADEQNEHQHAELRIGHEFASRAARCSRMSFSSSSTSCRRCGQPPVLRQMRQRTTSTMPCSRSSTPVTGMIVL